MFVWLAQAEAHIAAVEKGTAFGKRVLLIAGNPHYGPHILLANYFSFFFLVKGPQVWHCEQAHQETYASDYESPKEW